MAADRRFVLNLTYFIVEQKKAVECRRLLLCLALLSGASLMASSDVCYTLISRDSYGDTWNSDTLTLNSTGTNAVAAAPTGLDDGSKYRSGQTREPTESVCFACESYFIQPLGLNYDDEVSWFITEASGGTVAEASGTDSATFTALCLASFGLGVLSLFAISLFATRNDEKPKSPHPRHKNPVSQAAKKAPRKDCRRAGHRSKKLSLVLMATVTPLSLVDQMVVVGATDPGIVAFEGHTIVPQLSKTFDIKEPVFMKQMTMAHHEHDESTGPIRGQQEVTQMTTTTPARKDAHQLEKTDDQLLVFYEQRIDIVKLEDKKMEMTSTERKTTSSSQDEHSKAPNQVALVSAGQRMLTEAVITSEIKEAVNNAAKGDVIMWAAGTGDLMQKWNSDGWQINKEISLICSDLETRCTIDADASNSDERRVMIITSTEGEVKMEGIELKNGYKVSTRRIST